MKKNRQTCRLLGLTVNFKCFTPEETELSTKKRTGTEPGMTIKDIARISGVTPTTVSNVLNKRTSRVSSETVQKVLSVIEQTGYIPNRNARALASKSTRIIGVVFPKVAEGLLQDPFHSQLLSGIEAEIRRCDYYLMIHSISSYRDLYNLMGNWNVDGIIVLSLLDNESLCPQRMESIPTVFIDAYDVIGTFPNIGSQDYEGAMLATNHLIKQGHKRIGFIGYDSVIISRASVISQRIKGFSQALKEAQISCSPDKDIFTCGHVKESTLEEKKSLLSFIKEHSAVFVSADILAVEIMKILREEGIKIPTDLSIIGYDNLPVSELVSPMLSTVSQDIPQKGALAAQQLIKQIEGEVLSHPIPPLPNTLVLRESVAQFPE